MIRVEPRVDDRDARAFATSTGLPRLWGVHCVVTPLEVEEEVVVSARGRVRSLDRRACDLRLLCDPLRADVVTRRLETGDRGRLRSEVGVTRNGERDTDLGNRAGERAAGRFDLRRQTGRKLAPSARADTTSAQDCPKPSCSRRAAPR